ncbi:hypothetical protein HDU67_001930 [Dinochytrium kinnereticum]|nr:hypothetical protein HDU67_001930 [Dinochytrium kinnereticum]
MVNQRRWSGASAGDDRHSQTSSWDEVEEGGGVEGGGVKSLVNQRRWSGASAGDDRGSIQSRTASGEEGEEGGGVEPMVNQRRWSGASAGDDRGSIHSQTSSWDGVEEGKGVGRRRGEVGRGVKTPTNQIRSKRDDGGSIHSETSSQSHSKPNHSTTSQADDTSPKEMWWTDDTYIYQSRDNDLHGSSPPRPSHLDGASSLSDVVSGSDDGEEEGEGGSVVRLRRRDLVLPGVGGGRRVRGGSVVTIETASEGGAEVLEVDAMGVGDGRGDSRTRSTSSDATETTERSMLSRTATTIHSGSFTTARSTSPTPTTTTNNSKSTTDHSTSTTTTSTTQPRTHPNRDLTNPTHCATLIQSLYRAHRTRRHLHHLHASATLIQSHYRSHLVRRRLHRLQSVTRTLQETTRTIAKARERVDRNEREAHALKGVHASRVQQRETERRVTACRVLQRVWRGFLGRREGERRRRERSVMRRGGGQSPSRNVPVMRKEDMALITDSCIPEATKTILDNLYARRSQRRVQVSVVRRAAGERGGMGGREDEDVTAVAAKVLADLREVGRLFLGGGGEGEGGMDLSLGCRGVRRRCEEVFEAVLGSITDPTTAPPTPTHNPLPHPHSRHSHLASLRDGKKPWWDAIIDVGLEHERDTGRGRLMGGKCRRWIGDEEIEEVVFGGVEVESLVGGEEGGGVERVY